METVGPHLRQLATTALGGVAPFAGLPDRLHDALIEQGEFGHVAGGEVLFRQGDPGDALYVVLSGKLEVIREHPAAITVLRRLGRGDIVGELALLNPAPRSATVRAVRDSTLLRIAREPFDAALRADPELAISMLRRVGQILQRGFEPPRGKERHAVLTLVSLSAGPLVNDLADLLTRAFGGPSTVTRIEAPADTASVPAVATRVEQLEREGMHVLLSTDPARPLHDAWNAFCLREADEVIVLARPDVKLPRSLLEHTCHVILTDVEPESQPTFGLVEQRTHHCLAAGAGTDAGLERAVRRILGRSVGLVLSGGGAGALAHIGVIQALLDAGVRIDRIGGCSMGSLVAGMYATGRSPAEMESICHRELVIGNPLRDPAVPRYALTRGRKWGPLLRRIFGERRVEALPLDFFSVSADLHTAELVVHRRGLVSVAVGASMSLPGLVPPVAMDGRLLVDGGVLDNLPIDVMAGRDEGPIVAVDAMRARFQRRPGSGRPPSLMETLPRVAVLGSWRAARRHRELARVVIEPQLPDTGMLTFRQMPAMIAAGRAAAADVLARGGLAALNADAGW